MSASAAPLKLCTLQYDRNISFQTLHLNNKEQPPQMMKHKHEIQLHALYSDHNCGNDWWDLFSDLNINGRTKKQIFTRQVTTKLAKNILTNRFKILNNLIEYDLLNFGNVIFKLICKELLLK